MKLCEPHWNDLRGAINARGLEAMVSEHGYEAVGRIKKSIADGHNQENFDPLAQGVMMIYGNAIGMGGLEILGNKPDGTEHCPICTLKVPGWIEKAADAMKAFVDKLAIKPGEACPRCKVVGCLDPDSKSCSDNCLMRYRTAIQEALNELGIPQPGYPAPVNNAVEILRESMGQKTCVRCKSVIVQQSPANGLCAPCFTSNA